MEAASGRRRMLLVLLISFLALPCLSSCTAQSAELGVQPGHVGLRRLLATKKPVPKANKPVADPNTDCGNTFPKLDYAPVTSACTPKVAPTPACCAAFNKFACEYQSQVNNFDSICPIMFLSYLNLAGGYQDGYFIGMCIDGWKGLCV